MCSLVTGVQTCALPIFFQRVLVDPHDIAASFLVIFQHLPGQRMIMLPDAEKATERHHGVKDLAAVLVDHEIMDMAEAFPVQVIDGRSFHLVRCDRPVGFLDRQGVADRSEEHTSELQSLMRISYAVFCLKKKKKK